MNEIRAVIAQLQFALALQVANPKDKRIKKLLADAQTDLEKAVKSFTGQDSTFGNENPR